MVRGEDSFSEGPLNMKSFLDSLTSLNVKKGETLWNLWVEMGCSRGSFGTYRSTVVLTCIEEKFNAMIEEEESHKNAMIKRIDDHYKKLLSLSSELGEEFKEPPEDLPLLQLEKALRDLVAKAKEKKKERIHEIEVLKRKDEKLSESLGEKPYPMTLSAIPSHQEVQRLSSHIVKLSELKERRFGSFLELKCALGELMKKLNTEPSNSFERAILCEKDESFLPLSQERLNRVEKVLERLNEQLKHNMTLAEKMRSKIKSISKKLQLDERETNEFLSEYSGFSPDHLKELEFRLDELEVAKAQHLEQFIVSSRQELCEWWDKCFYTQKQRSLFSPFISTDYTEELLLQHEEEIERIKDYFYRNESLFRMVEQRQDLWDKKLELERRAKDPNRFHCKSTDFLKEEKDRKRVEKQLPKIEKSLEDAMEEYKLENGKEFLVGGIPYQTYMEIQIREHEDNLQREKEVKAQAKKQLIIQESRYGSTPAKLNSTKRKAPHTVDCNVSKKLRPNCTRGTINSTKSSTQSTLTRSVSTRAVSHTGSNRSRYVSDSSFVTGFGEFKMSLRSLDGKNPFLNPSSINANSTLQSEMTPRNFKKPPRTALTTGGRALSRRSRSAVVLGTKKSPVMTAKKSLFKTTTTKRVLTPSNSSIRSSARKKL